MNMKINVDRLDDQLRELDLPLEEEWLRAQLGDVLHASGACGGEARLMVVRQGAKVQVTGHLTARFFVPCGRCLEPAEVTVDEPFVMVFERHDPAHAQPAEQELSDDDVYWEGFEGSEIDLAPVLREPLILAVPMTPLCRPDCPGLPQPGGGEGPEAQDPVDPRWKALANLKLKS
jgi:uncharacterized protein